MKVLTSRFLLAAFAALTAWLLLTGAAASRAPILQPDKLIIESTTDVKGKTSPCG